MSLLHELKSAVLHQNHSHALFLLRLSHSSTDLSTNLSKDLSTDSSSLSIKIDKNLITAILCYHSGEHVECLRLLQKTERLLQKTDQKNNKLYTLLFYKALCQTKLNKLSEAIATYREILEIYDQKSDLKNNSVKKSNTNDHFNTNKSKNDLESKINNLEGKIDNLEKNSKHMNNNNIKYNNLNNLDSDLDGNLDSNLDNNQNEQSIYTALLSQHFILVPDVKHVHSNISTLLIFTEQCAVALPHLYKSIAIYSSFTYLYENMYVNERNSEKFKYLEEELNEGVRGLSQSDLNEKNENFMKNYNKQITLRTADSFKQLRNTLIDFLSHQSSLNKLVEHHKEIIRNRRVKNENNGIHAMHKQKKTDSGKNFTHKQQKGYTNGNNSNNQKYNLNNSNNQKNNQNNNQNNKKDTKTHFNNNFNTSVLVLQSCATLLFHNYSIDQSLSLFSFLFDEGLLAQNYQVIYSTVLWVKREKGRLGVLARRAVLENEISFDFELDEDLSDDFSNGKVNSQNKKDNGFYTSHKQQKFDNSKNISHKHLNNNFNKNQPLNANSLVILSNYFSLCSDHNRSIVCLKRAISSYNSSNISNSSILLYYYPFRLLAHELSIRHDHTESMKMFNRVVKMNRNAYSAWYGMGAVMIRSGGIFDTAFKEEFVAHLSAENSDESRNFETYQNFSNRNEDERQFGRGYFNEHNSSNSLPLHFFYRALSIVPLNRAVRYMLIKHIVKSGRVRQAIGEIERYLKIVDEEEKKSKGIEKGQEGYEKNEMTAEHINLIEFTAQTLKCVDGLIPCDEYTSLVLLELVGVLCNGGECKLANQVIKRVDKSTQGYEKKKDLVESGMSRG